MLPKQFSSLLSIIRLFRQVLTDTLLLTSVVIFQPFNLIWPSSRVSSIWLLHTSSRSRPFVWWTSTTTTTSDEKRKVIEKKKRKVASSLIPGAICTHSSDHEPRKEIKHTYNHFLCPNAHKLCYISLSSVWYRKTRVSDVRITQWMNTID